MDDVTDNDLIRWSEALAAIARTGLAFTDSLYESERYEEILAVAADIGAHVGRRIDADSRVEEWLGQVDRGVPGYVTPKVGVGAVVGNEKGEILLIQRSQNGQWLYPTGWADIGYSLAEVAVKEVREETGIEAEVVRVIGVVDSLRWGGGHLPFHMVVFHLRYTGGALVGHPLETRDLGWFSRDALPEPLAGAWEWPTLAFQAIDDLPIDTLFDPPRTEIWGRPDSVRRGPTSLRGGEEG